MTTLTAEEQKALEELEAESKPAEKPAAAAPKKAAPLETFIDAEALEKDASVNPHDIDADMITVSGRFAYYSAMATRARRQADRMKTAVKVMEAQLYEFHRNKLVESGEKVTEKLIENAIHRDPRWAAAQNRLSEANAIAELCEAAPDSMRLKRDVIIEIARNNREERKGQARVMDEEQREADKQARRDAALSKIGGGA